MMKLLSLVLAYLLIPLTFSFSDPDVIETYFPDANEGGGGWWETSWFGWIYPENDTSDWIYHEHHEWLRITDGDSSGSPDWIDVWEDAMKWSWYAEQYEYPDIMRLSDNRWYSYDIGSTNPREFYDYTDGIAKIDYTKDVPSYTPGYWNDGSTIQGNNKCYNYGMNCRTDNEAQPGATVGGSCCDWAPDAAVCDEIEPAILPPCDGSVVIGDENGPVPEGKARVVMLTDDGDDFHFVRQDSDGYWSHKEGVKPATNRDSNDEIIINPENSYFVWEGVFGPVSYHDFCGYYYVVNSSEQEGQSNVNITGPYCD